MQRFLGLSTFALMICLGGSEPLFSQSDEWTSEKLLSAAQQDDFESVKAALDAGVEVDSKTQYGATALSFACDAQNVEMVKALLDRGADPNIKDTFYNATPMTWARSKNNQEIILLLITNGADGADGILTAAVTAKQVEYAKKIIKADVVSDEGLSKAYAVASKNELDELVALFKEMKVELPEKVIVSPEQLKKFEGKYQGTGFTVSVEVKDDELMLGFNEASKSVLVPVSTTEFEMGNTKISFVVEGDTADALNLNMMGRDRKLTRVEAETTTPPAEETESPAETPAETAEPKFAASSAESLAADKSVSSRNWPSFRGNGARGVAEGQNPPVSWDATEEKNLKWKTPIPGLGLSCPAIYDDKIYITTAVNTEADDDLKIGLYGNVDSVEEDFVFDFALYCVDKNTGEIKWNKTAISTKPAVKRHTKSSYANPTVATDGKHVIAFFGSEGLYCYDTAGELLWKKDLGFLDSGWFYDASYQWGFGASPIIYGEDVIVQCDIQKDSFIASYRLSDGEENWRVDRDEIPTWSSPTVHKFGDLPMLLTHGTKAARGYDARNGELLWELPKHSEIVVPTPFVAHDLIFIASGYAPIQPIYAIRPEARGDITLPEDAEDSQYIGWRKKRGGPYMPSPIVYGDYLYTCANNGILTCYLATTGTKVYKKRVKIKGVGSASFTASPLAGDGHLYLTSETGHVVVIKAGPEFEIVATNPCGESVLATPAISEGVFYLRTQDSLVAIEE